MDKEKLCPGRLTLYNRKAPDYAKYKCFAFTAHILYNYTLYGKISQDKDTETFLHKYR